MGLGDMAKEWKRHGIVLKFNTRHTNTLDVIWDVAKYVTGDVVIFHIQHDEAPIESAMLFGTLCARSIPQDLNLHCRWFSCRQ